MQFKSVNRTSVPITCKSCGGHTEYSKGDTEHVERRRTQQMKPSRVKSSILTMRRRCFDSPRRRPSQSLKEQRTFKDGDGWNEHFQMGQEQEPICMICSRKYKMCSRKSSLLWLDHLPPSLCHNTAWWRHDESDPLGPSPDSTAQCLGWPWMSNMTTPCLSFHDYKTEIQESLRDN